MNPSNIDRRTFVERTVAAGAALGLAAGAPNTHGEPPVAAEHRRVRVGVIGCGNVSGAYLPNLVKCPFVELVSTCDRIPERAARAAARHNIPNHYPHIDKMLTGAPFDLLVNLTDIQEHEHLNRQAIDAGKHIWSEKPLANSLSAGQDMLRLARRRGTRLWGAPTTVNSPQFAYLAKAIAAGRLGRVAAAHASYGSTGPDWSPFFYEKGGGSLPDLAVYSLTTLTGLFGPAKRVVAMTSIVTAMRKIQGKGSMQVAAEDNAMVLLDHGDGVISHVQSGFNYFKPRRPKGTPETKHTISIVGTTGSAELVGYDWEPQGIDLATADHPAVERVATEKGAYSWEQGASLAAECLATGKEFLNTPEHALHVVDIIVAARQSQQMGGRVALSSSFKWPLVS